MYNSIGYKGINRSRPEVDPVRIVACLLNDLKQAAFTQNMEKHQQASDELAVFTKAYILPHEPEIWHNMGLTTGERVVADVLHAKLGHVVRRDTIMNALYFDRPNDEPDQKIIDVFMCKIRKKVRAAGYEIVNIHGVGYRMVHS